MLTTDEIVSCRTDLLTFTNKMFEARKGTVMKGNSHQVTICNALERVVIGEITELIITIPPRSGKTEFAVINFIAWCMGNWPDSEFIHASYSHRLATTNTYQARSIMQHERYLEIFGKPRFKGDSNAKDEFRTEEGGIVYAAGAGGTITGYGAGKMRDTFGGAIIIDDPHKADEALSAIMRQNVIEWFSNTMEHRRNSPKTPIIIIMQRLHDNDLAGYLLNGGNGQQWHHVSIPAINELGESFWPDQFPLEKLRRLEKANSYIFAGQYLQQPIILGGNIIKRRWFRTYKVAPLIKYRIVTADTASKTKEHNDYSVFQCWGFGDDGKIYLLDMLRNKWEIPELERVAVSFWMKHMSIRDGGQLRTFYVEEANSGTGIIQKIQRNGNIPIKGVMRTKDKLTRVLDVLSYIEAGLVCVPEDAPFTSDFLAECESFTPDNTHMHDDQIDPMIDAVNIMLANNKIRQWENF
jgi:predicted phage terminase large subunit-like protein